MQLLLIRMETQAGEEVGISVGNAVPIYILQPETLAGNKRSSWGVMSVNYVLLGTEGTCY